MRKAIGVLSWVLAASFLFGTASVRGDAPAPDSGEPALAERMVDLARAALHASNVTVQNFRLAAALLEAAHKLNPKEPRIARLWADAALQAGDSDLSLRAIKAYLAIVPDDKPALIQMADLYARKYQTVDAKVTYLQSVVDVAGLPEVVRSHIAYRMYEAYSERAQTPEANASLDKSLKLNPLNIDALRAKYAEVANGTPAEQLPALLALLKANPAQLAETSRVAQILSDAGLANESLPFYNRAIDTAQRQNTPVQPAFVLSYAIELSLLPSATVPTAPVLAKQLDDLLLKSDPANYEALVFRLMLQRQANQKDDAAKTTQQVLNVLSNRLQAVRLAMGQAGATTRPVESPDPVIFTGLDEDVKRLKAFKGSDKVNPDAVKSEFTTTLGEIAWFELYFNNKPNDAKPAIEALRQLLPENSPLIVRLDGWSFLARGEKDAAKVKLSAVKEKDPLAELGLLKIAGPSAKSDAEKFLAAHPSGMIATMTMDSFHDYGLTLVPEAKQTAPLTVALKTFPTNWLTIVDSPQNFYMLRAEPLKAVCKFAEPMMARVTLQNISDMPITLSAEGVVRPDLWFDFDVHGMFGTEMQKGIMAGAVDRLGQEIVIAPKQAVTQVVRLDEGQLQELLNGNPAPSFQVNFDVRTNPTTFGAGIGPAGQMGNAMRPLERENFPLTSDSLTRVMTALQKGTPEEKIRNLDLASQMAVLFGSQKDNPEATQAVQQMFEAVKADARDPSQPVQAWTAAVILRFLPANERMQFLTKLSNDPYWASRLIGLVSMAQITLPEQRSLLKQAIQHDTDPVVVAVAKNLSALLEHAAAATTQATTKPSPLPATSKLTTGQPPTSQPTGPAVEIPSNLPLSLPPTTQKGN